MNASSNLQEQEQAELQCELDFQYAMRRALNDRLRPLKLQNAKMGYNTPPDVLTQITETEKGIANCNKEIADLENRLGVLSKGTPSDHPLPPVTTERPDISPQEGLPPVESRGTGKINLAAGGSPTVEDLIRQKSEDLIKQKSNADEVKRAIQPIAGYIDKFQKAIDPLHFCTILDGRIEQLKAMLLPSSLASQDSSGVQFVLIAAEVYALLDKPWITWLQDWAEWDESVQPKLRLIDEKTLATFGESLQRALEYAAQLTDLKPLVDKRVQICEILRNLGAQMFIIRKTWECPQNLLREEIMHRLRHANELLAPGTSTE